MRKRTSERKTACAAAASRLGLAAAVFALAIVASSALTAQEAAECAVTVQPGESIQEAIDAAAAGDVICIAAGTYQEVLVITHEITVRGTGETPADVEIKGTSRTEPGITITNPEGSEEPFSVTFENITLSNRYPAKFHGIEVLGTAGIILTNAQVIGSMRYGLILRDSSTAKITSSTISDSKNGLLIEDAAEASFAGCSVVKSEVLVKGSAYVQIADSDFSATSVDVYAGAGISAIESTLDRGTHRVSGTADYTDCSFQYGGGNSVNCNASARLTMTGCNVSHNGRGHDYGSGVRLEGNSQAVIDSCVFADNAGTPVWLMENATLHITDCSILRNDGLGIAGFLEECGDIVVPGGVSDDLFVGSAFGGRISGSGNTIPGPDEEDGNTLGDVCPDSFRSVKD